MSDLIYASLIAPRARCWLAQTISARILHLFDRVCNLINERGEILSLVAPEIGPGPFALVLPGARPFSNTLSTSSEIGINDGILRAGSLKVDITNATIWQPVPEWNRLRQTTAVWQTRLRQLPKMIADYRRRQGMDVPSAFSVRFAAAAERFLHGLVMEDTAACQAGARALAGLGPGLTPAGDDFLLGAMYGLRVRQGETAARYWNKLIVTAAAPRTTALSAAWLRAAAAGEAVEAWHGFCRHSAAADQWRTAAQRILNTGHSSGADALAGFTAVLLGKTKIEQLPG